MTPGTGSSLPTRRSFGSTTAGINAKVVHWDPDIVSPIGLPRTLAEEGVIGGVAPRTFSLMGYVAETGPLVADSGPVVAEALLEDEVEVALLVPA